MSKKINLPVLCAVSLACTQCWFYNIFTRNQKISSDLDSKILQIEPLRATILEFLDSPDLTKLCEVGQSFNKDYGVLLWAKVTSEMLTLEDKARIHHNILINRLEHIQSLQYNNKIHYSVCIRAATLGRFLPYLKLLSTKLEYYTLLQKLKVKCSCAEIELERDFIDKIRDNMTELLGEHDINTLIANCTAQMNQVAEALDANPAVLEIFHCTREAYFAPWTICIESYTHLKKASFFLDLLENLLKKNQPSFLSRAFHRLFS